MSWERSRSLAAIWWGRIAWSTRRRSWTSRAPCWLEMLSWAIWASIGLRLGSMASNMRTMSALRLSSLACS